MYEMAHAQEMDSSFVLSGVAVDCWQSFRRPSATASAEAWPSALPL